MAEAQLADEPTARNSKRLPVKANGDVRLRSVLSTMISGIWSTLIFKPFFPASSMRSSESLFRVCRIFLTAVSREYGYDSRWRLIGSRRWAFVADIIEAFNSPLCRCTAAIVLATNVINCRLSWESCRARRAAHLCLCPGSNCCACPSR